MLNILLFGDLHARMSQGANLKPIVTDLSLSFLSSRLTVIVETLEWLKEVVKEYDVRKIIDLGDIYEHIGVDTYTRNIVYDMLGSIARKVNDNFVTLTGNHDTSSTSDPFDSILFSHNAYSEIIFANYKIEFLQPINSVFVYVPYFLSKRKLISLYKDIHEDLKKYPKKTKKYLFAHHNIKELISFGKAPTGKELNLKIFDRCFFGHIHYRKEIKNIESIGSIITENFNDMGDLDRGVTILKVDGSKYEKIFIPNPHSPYYVRLSEKDFKGKQKELEKIRELKSDNRRIYVELVDIPESIINSYKHLFDLISIGSDINRQPINIEEEELGQEALSNWKSYLRDRFINFLDEIYPDLKKDHKIMTKMFLHYLKRAEDVE